jgi:hypothetical protein
MVSSNGAARSCRRSVEVAPVEILHCAPRCCSTCLRRPRLCSPLPPLRRLLENQLPITTRAERPQIAPPRQLSDRCPLFYDSTASSSSPGGTSASRSTAAASTSLQERNRSRFVSCGRSLAPRSACCCSVAHGYSISLGKVRNDSLNLCRVAGCRAFFCGSECGSLRKGPSLDGVPLVDVT